MSEQRPTERETVECDEEVWRADDPDGRGDSVAVVHVDFARTLERQRDHYREQRDGLLAVAKPMINTAAAWAYNYEEMNRLRAAIANAEREA